MYGVNAGGTFSTLNNVKVTNPQDNDIISFNGTTKQWVNMDVGGLPASVFTTGDITGNGLASNPLQLTPFGTASTYAYPSSISISSTGLTESVVAGTAPLADPTTTTGDLIYRLGANLARLPISSATFFLGATGGVPTWQPIVLDTSITGNGVSQPLTINVIHDGTLSGGGNSGSPLSVVSTAPSIVTSSPVTGVGTNGSPVTLLTSTATPGSFTLSNITLLDTGLVSSASSGVINSTLAGSGTSGQPLGLATSGVTPGNYTFMGASVDQYGRIDSASNGIPTVTTAAPCTGTGASGTPVTLSSSGVTPGSYTNLSGTVDTYGRLTAASSGSAFSNPMTTKGDMIIGGTSGALTRLAGPTGMTTPVLSYSTGTSTEAWVDFGNSPNSSNDAYFCQDQNPATGTIAIKANSLVTITGYTNSTNNVDVTSGIYTCPFTGRYGVSVFAISGGTWATGFHTLNIRMQNGANVFQVAGQQCNASSNWNQMSTSWFGHCIAGNTLQTQIINGAAGSLGSTNFFVSFTYLGP